MIVPKKRSTTVKARDPQPPQQARPITVSEYRSIMITRLEGFRAELLEYFQAALNKNSDLRYNLKQYEKEREQERLMLSGFAARLQKIEKRLGMEPVPARYHFRRGDETVGSKPNPRPHEVPQCMRREVSAADLKGKTILTIPEAAKYLGLSAKTVSSYAAEHKMPSLSVEGKIRFDQGELDNWKKLRPGRGRQLGSGYYSGMRLRSRWPDESEKT
jgi:excisionase family DNA binding protein